MKYTLFSFITLVAILSSCSNQSTSSLVASKLNELTNNPSFVTTKDNYFYARIFDEDIKNDKESYSIIYELQDYLYNDLHLYSTADTMKIIDPYNIIIDYIADDAIITTSVIYEDIGPDNHPIWRYRCAVEVKQK